MRASPFAMCVLCVNDRLILHIICKIHLGCMYSRLSYLKAFIRAAIERRPTRAFTKVAPTMPGIV